MRILIVALLFPSIVFAQNLSELSLNILNRDYEREEHRSVYLSSSGDTITKKKIGGIYVRQDYDNYGSLKAEYKVEIKKLFHRDTTTDRTQTKLKIVTVDSLKDVPFGQINEYHSTYLMPDGRTNLKTKAFLKDGKITGTLMHFPRMEEILITVKYNNKGMIEGTYNEFYLTNGNISKPKCKGQYGYVSREKILFNPDTYSYAKTTVLEIQKVGLWQYYDLNGDLESRQNHEWHNYNKDSVMHLKLQNTIWMFNPNMMSMTSYYEEPYEFLKFEADNKVLFLNIHGDSIGSSNYDINRNGSLKLEKGKIFHRISMDSHDQISLVVEEADIWVNDEPVRKGEIKLEYIKLDPTNIVINDIDLEAIKTNSKWLPLVPKPTKNEDKNFMSITKLNSKESNSDNNGNNKYQKSTSYHLLRIEDSIVFISKIGKNSTSKLAVTAISNSTLVVSSHYGNDEVCVFERK